MGSMMVRGNNSYRRKTVVVLLLALIGHAQQSNAQSAGVLTGTVTDAVFGGLLQNVTVTVAGLSTLTNNEGKYTIAGIPLGTLKSEFSASPLSGNPPLLVQFHDESTEGTQRVVASANGFISYSNNQVVIIPNDTVTLSFSMSRVLVPGSMRFVLNWGARPRDLDSHLRTPVIGAQPYHIYYPAGSRGSAVDTPFVTLDRDVVNGFGPETITMYRFFAGTYHYYVHRFPSDTLAALTQSNAVVQVYSNAGLFRTIRTPSVGTGIYWHVCDIDGITKTITVINQIVASEPGGQMITEPFPSAKNISYSTTTRSDTILSWLWNFGDGSTSTLQNPRHIYQQDGSYTVSLRVTSNASQNTETKIGFIAVGPVFAVTLTGDTTAGSPINVSALAAQGFPVSRAMLFYRLAGKTLFDSLVLAVNGQSVIGTLPGTVVTARGLEYFVRLTGSQRVVTNPFTNPLNNPLVLRVKVGSLASPQQFQPIVYRMISIPLELADGRVAAQLFDDFGPYNPARYRLFQWNERNGNEEYSPPDRDTLETGHAYWLIIRDGQGFDANDGRSGLSDRPFDIVLEPGWNQIASPFAFPVSWTSIINSDNNKVSRPFFYNGVEYDSTVQILEPWEGYFVLNDSSQAITLSVRPIEAQSRLQKKSPFVALNGEHDYALRLSASDGAFKDTYNYVGLMEHALQGYDKLDLPEPPMIGDYVSLSIVESGRNFIANFKPINNEGQQWEMRITSTVPNQTVCVSLNESGVLPSGFGVHVLDEDEFAAIPLEGRSFTVQLGDRNTVRSFKVIVGTKAYAEHSSAGIPLTPVEYSLEQNYPNPFNPSTTIRYSLNKRSAVALEIYNTLGQRVKTLVHGEQTTGTYSIVWNGSNDAGSFVSSGMYFYHLHAGEFRASKKLLLLR